MDLVPIGLGIVIGIATVLFVVKAVYGLSIALVLPLTRGALYVSTAKVRVAAGREAIDPAPGLLLLDLGCGDGQLLRSTCRLRIASTMIS